MKKTSVLITGCDGQLGRSLRQLMECRDDIELSCADIDTLDITDPDAVKQRVCQGAYDIVVNCAAYTAVDNAEENPDKAKAINTDAVENLAVAAAAAGSRIIHISTDYVFSGDNCRPYKEDDTTAPGSVYGRTKLEGERLLSGLCPDSVIIRTAWLYSPYGHNFVKTIINHLKAGRQLKVVCDQIGTPTSATDLAAAITAIIGSPAWNPGIYHFTDEGVASWYDFAKAIADLSGLDASLISPVATGEYPAKAQRPGYSVLDKSKIKTTFGIMIPYWRDALGDCLKALS